MVSDSVLILNKYNNCSDIFYTFKRRVNIIYKLLNKSKLYNLFYILLFLLTFNNRDNKNFLNKFRSSFSSKKIRQQKSSGKSRVGDKSSGIFVGGYYCFGFREINFKFYDKMYDKYINYFFNFLNINKRFLINCLDYTYLRLIFSLYTLNNYRTYFNHYYLLYFNKFYKNKYSFNFKNNVRTVDLCSKSLKIYNNIMFF